MKDNGTAKARIVVPGFQDHPLGTLATASPTTSVRGISLALQVRANLELKFNTGDVRAAFLQPRGSEMGTLVEPVPEFGHAMWLRSNTNRAAPQEGVPRGCF